MFFTHLSTPQMYTILHSRETGTQGGTIGMSCPA